MYRDLFHNAPKKDYPLLPQDYRDMEFFITACSTLLKKTNGAIKKKEADKPQKEKGDYRNDTDRMRLDFLKFLRKFIPKCGLFFEEPLVGGLFSACSEANLDSVLDKFVTAVHSAIFGRFQKCSFRTEEGDEKQIIPYDKRGINFYLLNSF
jgi:hypothetical protein